MDEVPIIPTLCPPRTQRENSALSKTASSVACSYDVLTLSLFWFCVICWRVAPHREPDRKTDRSDSGRLFFDDPMHLQVVDSITKLSRVSTRFGPQTRTAQAHKSSVKTTDVSERGIAYLRFVSPHHHQQ